MAIINYINTGSGANSGDGDSLRTAFSKINSNFDSLVSNFVAAGVTSWNGRVGIVEFTNTDLLTLLGYTPYPSTNPDGFITSSTVSLSNYAKIEYVNTAFVFVSDLSTYNFASTNYVDLKLTEYPTLTYLDDQQYLTSINLPNFLTQYITDTELETFGTGLRNFTTDTVFQEVNNTSLIPAQADLFNLGEESFRWSTLYLSDAIYIKGIGISIEPLTGRLLVDGNDQLGGFTFNANSISRSDQVSFSITNNNGIQNSSAWLQLPGPNTNNFEAVSLVNTGTAGVSLVSGDTQLRLTQTGVLILGNLSLPLRLQGQIFTATSLSTSTTLLTSGDHYLEVTRNSWLRTFYDEDVVIPQTITSRKDTNTFSPLNLKGNIVSLISNTFTDYTRNLEIEFSGLLSISQQGVYIGLSDTEGSGNPANADSSFEGYKLPLVRGQAGQVLGIVSTSTYVDTVDWVTPAGGAGLSLTALPSGLIPNANLAYDLGSSSYQWRSLYVGTSTIYLGGTALSVDPSGSLTINGNTIGGGSSDRLVNGGHTFSLDANGSLNINNGEVNIATNNWGISVGGGTGATGVVYTAKRQDLASIKVHATIEGVEDGDTTGQHSQACDMMIVRRVATSGAVTVDAVVYGVIYTSVGPLATLDAHWDAVSNKIEITATPTSATNNVYVKVYATEVARGD